MNINVIDSAAAIGTNTATQEGDITPMEPVFTFRKLNSTDTFLMFKILGKIGINELTKSFDAKEIKALVESNKDKGSEEATAAVGMSVILGMANLIISKLPYCEEDIYQMLSNTSDLSVEKIKSLDFVTFAEMVISFIKKEEFKDFIKVVLKLFKLAN